MSGNDIKFATRTPQIGSSSASPLRLRTWFDHTRNMMVVEVVTDKDLQDDGPSGD